MIFDNIEKLCYFQNQPKTLTSYEIRKSRFKTSSVFQQIVNLAGNIGISQTVIINLFLIIQIIAQIVQIIFLYYIGKGTLIVFIITIPTWLIAFYYRNLIKISKQRPVWIVHTRVFASMLAIIVIADFSYLAILAHFHMNTFFKEEFVSEVCYLISIIAFMSVMYLLSCGEAIVKTNQQKELPNKEAD